MAAQASVWSELIPSALTMPSALLLVALAAALLGPRSGCRGATRPWERRPEAEYQHPVNEL